MQNIHHIMQENMQKMTKKMTENMQNSERSIFCILLHISCGGVRCGLTATPGRDRPAMMRGRPRPVVAGLWGKSSLMAWGALLLASGGSGVLCLGPGDQVSDQVAKTRSSSLLRLVEGVAKPSQHSWAASVGGLLSGVRRPKTAQKRPGAACWHQ